MTTKADQKFWLEEKQRYDDLNPSKKRRTKLLAQTVNIITVIVALSFLFYPIEYRAQLIFFFAIPWIVLFIVRSQHEYLRVFSFKESPYPGFGTTYTLAYWLIIVRACIDYTVLDYTNAWWTMLLSAPIISWLFLRLTKDEIGFRLEKKVGKAILFSCFLLAFSLYAFFGAILINCAFDNSPSSFAPSTVLNKYTSDSGRSGASYYVNVELPAKFGTSESVMMSKKRWDRISEGQSLKLEIRDGLLGIDWLAVHELNNNVLLQFAVRDKKDESPIATSKAVITTSNTSDTVYHASDSLFFLLDFDKEYAVEFQSDGYQSKTILFNTLNVPEEEKPFGFIFSGVVITLIPQDHHPLNDTVATFAYDVEQGNFEFEKVNE